MKSIDSRSQRRRQGGSAFILVLMALVVLTIFGLALASITQSELTIGSNDRGIWRAFYDADTGRNILIARKIVNNDPNGKTYVMPDSVRSLGTAESTRDQVEVSMLLPVLTAPCNLCEINNATSYNPPYVRSNGVAVQFGSRVGVQADQRSTVTIPQRSVGENLDIQPTQVPPEKTYANQQEIDKINKGQRGG